MKNYLGFLFLIILIILASSANAQTTFERWYGGSSEDVGYCVSQTFNKEYIIAGYTHSLGAGQSDVYLIRTDSLGDTIWTKAYGDTNNECGRSVIQIPNGGFMVAGYTNSFGAGSHDVYLIRTDSLGDTIWTKTYGGTNNDVGYSIAQTFDGGYIIAGFSQSFSAGDYDFYVIKTDSNGDTLWTRTYGGSGNDYGYSVAQTSDSGYIVVGATASFGSSVDVYLVKTDALGDTLWTKTIGGSDYDDGLSVSQTSDGGYIIGGTTDSYSLSVDFYLVKTDSFGNVVFMRNYGGNDFDGDATAIQTFDGGYILTGHTMSFGAGDDDLYLIKTDANGDTVWTRTHGGIERDAGFCISQCLDGGYVIAGITRSFGADQEDVYLIKTDTLGNVAGIEEQLDQRHEVKDLNLLCQPNPFTTSTTVTLPSIERRAKAMEVHIFDASGRLVKSVKLEANTYQLGADLKPGIYFLKFNGKTVGKVVKVR